MDALVTLHTGYPHNRVIRSIRGCDPGRASSDLSLAPSKHYRGRTCRSNFVGLDLRYHRYEKQYTFLGWCDK